MDGKRHARKDVFLLDHPILIGEFGKGHISKNGYKSVNKIGHPNAIKTRKM